MLLPVVSTKYPDVENGNDNLNQLPVTEYLGMTYSVSSDISIVLNSPRGVAAELISMTPSKSLGEI